MESCSAENSKTITIEYQQHQLQVHATCIHYESLALLCDYDNKQIVTMAKQLLQEAIKAYNSVCRLTLIIHKRSPAAIGMFS